MSELSPDKRGEVLLCCASGEGSHQFKVVADEAGVMAFLEEMCGGEEDGTMTHSLAHYRDEDNWSNGGTAYNVKLYCAEFSVWKVLPGELVFTPSHERRSDCPLENCEKTGRCEFPQDCDAPSSAASTTRQNALVAEIEDELNRPKVGAEDVWYCVADDKPCPKDEGCSAGHCDKYGQPAVEKVRRLARLANRAAEALKSSAPSATPCNALPVSEWHEDMGDVLWWKFPINEPPWVGSPLDAQWPLEPTLDEPLRPYFTHFTRLVIPANNSLDGGKQT